MRNTETPNSNIDGKGPQQIQLRRNHVSAFERTLEKSQNWINEIHKELSWTNPDEVYPLLRAVLQTLRDQLSVHEAAQLAAQLPLLLKGTFYDSWNPRTKTPDGLTKDEFLVEIKKRMGPAQNVHFDLESGVQVVMAVMMRHISPGEVSDVFSSLKPMLKHFLEKAPSFSSKATPLGSGDY